MITSSSHSPTLMLIRNDVIRIMDTWKRSQDDRTFCRLDSKRKDCINEGPNYNRPNKDFKTSFISIGAISRQFSHQRVDGACRKYHACQH